MRLAPSLHRLGNDIVASYLITTPAGITLIDAGLPGMYADLRRELDTIGRPIDDIRGVVLTHGDSDHVGFAERLRREKGVPVFVHAADADRARGGDKPKTAMGPMRLGPLLSFAAYGIRKGMRPNWLTEVREVADGDTLDLPGAPRVIGMPGHSPGSIAVFSADARAVFVGDALTTRHVLTGRTGPGPAPFTDDSAEALASLARIADLDADWVLPGHGPAFHGSPSAAVDAVRAAALG
ncbi:MULTISPECIES: MBL fold metallo-hydrolase [Microbacterium]|uniref:MBL fold metallo-hydrolase n=1 Tax=Microbacterium TaxID=33882 RepID=UPI00277E4629|nr:MULTISPECIES: MBL fold metallo-hydrolase [Microbacterium]MDQ1074236.1 glyoxylase-like metal-dependent hydrolase (beta-lactamase superfamily II) [Microbacterium sp. SORGH_AS_0969]MDQ1114463.1 glyoxylase-like metal-dependent hydrolase (beta-lactamase superfamily II) [Microbacterium testaceum]